MNTTLSLLLSRLTCHPLSQPTSLTLSNLESSFIFTHRRFWFLFVTSWRTNRMGSTWWWLGSPPPRWGRASRPPQSGCARLWELISAKRWYHILPPSKTYSCRHTWTYTYTYTYLYTNICIDIYTFMCTNKYPLIHRHMLSMYTHLYLYQGWQGLSRVGFIELLIFWAFPLVDYVWGGADHFRVITSFALLWFMRENITSDVWCIIYGNMRVVVSVSEDCPFSCAGNILVLLSFIHNI